MNILDRTKPPKRHIPEELPVFDLKPRAVFNAVPVYTIEGGDRELVHVQMVFDAGTRFEEKPQVAGVCSAMLKEGTRSRTADEISDLLDFHGAKIHASISKDRATVSLLALNDDLPKLMPLFAEVITEPQFPEDELQTHLTRHGQALEVSLKRVEVVCRLKFSQILFGDSFYADRMSPEDFKDIEREDIQNFYRKHYRPENARCFIAGKNTDSALKYFEKTFAQWELPRMESAELRTFDWDYRKTESCENWKDAVQTAIRMGKPGISGHHPDHTAVYFLNTVLGGYFGSRLMQNIREEKGFTYGIGSSMNVLNEAAYLVISTQVGAQFTDQTIAEIKKEIDLLSKVEIGADEMDLVKNFLSGQLLRSLDGPFNQGRSLKYLVNTGLPGTYYRDLVKSIFALKVDDLLEAALKYFDVDEFSMAAVGKCES